MRSFAALRYLRMTSSSLAFETPPLPPPPDIAPASSSSFERQASNFDEAPGAGQYFVGARSEAHPRAALQRVRAGHVPPLGVLAGVGHPSGGRSPHPKLQPLLERMKLERPERRGDRLATRV